MYVDKHGKVWYKGNLHTHTTRSDGKLSPERVARLYKEAGYDFFAFTDHWIFEKGGWDGEMLVLSGGEYDAKTKLRDGIFHIVGIGMTDDPRVNLLPSASTQEIINEIKNCNGIAILAHPAWSLNTPEQINKLQGIDAVEIYNSVSDLPHSSRPYSGLIIDMLASMSRLYPCIAADDAHFYDGEEMKSWIMVQSESLTRESILESIREGKFHATQGPHFEMTIREGKVCVECPPESNIECVVFFTDTLYVKDRTTVRSKDKPVTGAYYTIKPSDSFVRVEVVDDKGRYAWSSPVKV
ncbi:MAG TPA: CehA/McbA family metallohydrolase [Clostridiaceae bacterium]|jgi:hypothetical protein|nr:CehA/McbA family metallohydrolase [Clostridiaceae bacterium]